MNRPQVCLDTHVLSWHLARPAKLGAAARRILQRVDAGKVQALVSSLVFIELTLLGEGKRNTVTAREASRVIDGDRFRILPLDLEQAVEFATLTAIRDPFDRMIVAAARCMKVPLLTGDGTITESGVVDVIWE